MVHAAVVYPSNKDNFVLRMKILINYKNFLSYDNLLGGKNFSDLLV